MVFDSIPPCEVADLDTAVGQTGRPGQRSTGRAFEAADAWLFGSALAALVYADLFDYPLTLDEIVKFQVGTDFPVERLADALRAPALEGTVTHTGRFFSLTEREEVVSTRAMRYRASRKVWRRARLYTRWLARLPYVRMVAVTGALAVDNIGDLPDIDLLVVAAQGRVWLCRRALVALVRIAKLFGDELCPNYIIADNRLVLDQRDFFTAHELSQMVPLVGRSLYGSMLRANSWARVYLPRGFDGAAGFLVRRRAGAWQALPEKLLDSAEFDRWERWELDRLRRKLSRSIGESAEVICTTEQCKGHTGYHRSRIMARYRDRLGEFGLADWMPSVLQPDFGAIDLE